MWDVSCMCLWSLLRAAGLLRLCVARPFRLPVSLMTGLVTLSYTVARGSVYVGSWVREVFYIYVH